MNDKLAQMLDVLANAAIAYENDNAQIYANEILNIQEERDNLKEEIKQLESEIASNNNRLTSNENNLKNTFSVTFDIFHEDAIRKEQEAKKNLEEYRKKAQEEKETLQGKIDKVNQVIQSHQTEIKHIKAGITSASSNKNSNQGTMVTLMEKHLSSVKEELKISRKEKASYNRRLKTIDKNIQMYTNNYEEAKKARQELAAEYEVYKRGYTFQYGEKKDGSGEIELQVVKRKKQIERQNAVTQARINEANQKITQLDKREAFLSVSASKKRENIIALINKGADYSEIKPKLEDLVTYINEEEVKETEQQLVTSIEEYKEKIGNTDYINHKEKERDEQQRKEYQKRLIDLAKEIQKADLIINASIEVNEQELEPYRENIRNYEVKKQALLKESVLMTADTKMNARELKRMRLISNGIKEIDERLDKLEKEKNERREELQQAILATRDKAIADRAHFEQEYAQLTPRMQAITLKLLNPTNYFDFTAKLGDQLKLDELEGKLESLRMAEKYLKEPKEDILNKFEKEYKNIQTEKTSQNTSTNNIVNEPNKNGAEISEDLFNRIIAHNENTDGYAMGSTQVGLPDGVNYNQPRITDNRANTLGLPGETLDGTKVGNIEQDVYEKIKADNPSKELPALIDPATLLELPGETLDGTKVGDIEQDVYNKLKTENAQSTGKEAETKEEEEEIYEVFSIKDIPRKLLNKIKQFIKNHPILTAVTGAIVIGVGVLGFKNDKELTASGKVTTETTIAGKDDETPKIGDTYVGTEGEKAYESSDYDYGGKNKSTSAAGENQINAFSFIDKVTGHIVQVEREEGKSIEDVIKENNIDIDNSKVRVQLGEKGWKDISVAEIKDQMSKEGQVGKSEYDFNLTDAQISDSKIVLNDENGQKIEINTPKLTQGSNQINTTGSDGKLYQGTVEVTEHDKLNDQGDQIKSWSFANVKENAQDILEGLNIRPEEDYTVELADASSLDEEAKRELANSIVEDMASQDYIVDTSASGLDNANYGRGRK